MLLRRLPKHGQPQGGAPAGAGTCAWSQAGGAMYAPDPANDRYFGISTSLSYDGTVMVVGAPGGYVGGPLDQGVYTYDWNGTAWVQRGSVLTVGNALDAFGSGVKLSADGDVLVVGATGYDGTSTDQGAVYTYDRVGTAWVQRGTALTAGNPTRFTGVQVGTVLKASDAADSDQFGWSAALAANGTILAVGAPYNGAVYIYDKVGDNWVQRVIITSTTGNFGSAVALSDDGVVLSVGARFNTVSASAQGVVVTYTWNGSSYAQDASLLVANDAGSTDYFGSAVKLNGAGTMLVVSAPQWDIVSGNEGKIYTYTRSGGTWTLLTSINVQTTYSSSKLGGLAGGLALSKDGMRLAAIDSVSGGIIRTWFFTGSSWNQYANTLAMSGASSLEMSADGSILFVGRGTTNEFSEGGVVLSFTWNSGSWSPEPGGLVCDLDVASAQFGKSVAVSGGIICVSAIQWAGSPGYIQGGVFTYTLPPPVSQFAAASDYFGDRLALTADGGTLVVSATGRDATYLHQGGVYTYDWNGTQWAQRGAMLVNDGAGDSGAFGATVSLSGTGDVLVVGTRAGKVYTYDRVGDQWAQRGVALTGTDIFFGYCEISASGNTLMVGAIAGGVDMRGAVYTYDLVGTDWVLRVGSLQSSTPQLLDVWGQGEYDSFGQSIAISANGSTLVVGAPGRDLSKGVVYTYKSGCTQTPPPNLTLVPFPWDQALPVIDTYEYVNFYNDPSLDAVQLNVNIGGDQAAWSSTAYYNMLNYTGNTGSFKVDGGYRDISGTNMMINLWSTSGTFGIGDVLVRYTPNDSVNIGTVITGLREYPGVASRQSFGNCGYVQWSDIGKPISLEMWYSENKYKTNSSVRFNGYTLFGDQANNGPRIYELNIAGEYIRKYVCGIMRTTANVSNPNISDIMYGIVYTGTAAGGTGMLVVNGAIAQSGTCTVGMTALSAGFENVFGTNDPNLLNGYAGSANNVWMNAVNHNYLDTQTWTYAPGAEINLNINAWDPGQIYGFDTKNVKYGVYVDRVSSLPEGTPTGEVFYLDPPMMYTHPGWPIPPTTLAPNDIVVDTFGLYANNNLATDEKIYHWSPISLRNDMYGDYGVFKVRGGSAIDFASVASVSYGLVAPTVPSHDSVNDRYTEYNFRYLEDNSIIIGKDQLNSSYSGAAMATINSYFVYLEYVNYTTNRDELVAAMQAAQTSIRVSFRRADDSIVAQLTIPIQPAPLDGIIRLDTTFPNNRLLLMSEPVLLV